MSDVLVVEDEAGVQMFVAEALRRAGIRCRITASGPQALAQANAAWPGAVLLDLTLPGPMDGWQVWDALEHMAGSRSLNVVLFAADLDATDRAAAVRRGAAGILRKPASAAALLAAVMRAFGTHREALAQGGCRGTKENPDR